MIANNNNNNLSHTTEQRIRELEDEIQELKKLLNDADTTKTQLKSLSQKNKHLETQIAQVSIHKTSTHVFLVTCDLTPAINR